jgi:hypothetical protein
MAASGVWNVSGHVNTPESPYDAFLRSPRDKDGQLHLMPAKRRYDEDWEIFTEVTRNGRL